MSQYAREIRTFLASQETDQTPPEDTAENGGRVIHVYHTPEGGVVLSSVALDTDEEQPPIIDPQPPAPQAHREPPFYAVMLLIFFLFLLLDSLDTTITNLTTPTATITLTPVMRTITLANTMQLGKLLAPLTVSQSLTVPTTGHKHQDAARASGTLTIYNAAFSAQTIPAGTIYTGQSGYPVATDSSVTIPPNTPPNDGVATVGATAINAGANGNMPAGDIALTTATLQIKNSQFTGGRDERTFSVVTRSDLDTTSATLKNRVTASMTAALRGQLSAGDQLHQQPCTPTIAADHSVNDEASALTVTVSETCTAIVYNTQELQARSTQLLTTQADKTLGRGYTTYGQISVTVKRATVKAQAVYLTFSAMGTWFYQINTRNLTTLIAGKPRAQAIQFLLHVPGIQYAAITGIAANDLLPLDSQHIKFMEIIGA